MSPWYPSVGYNAGVLRPLALALVLAACSSPPREPCLEQTRTEGQYFFLSDRVTARPIVHTDGRFFIDSVGRFDEQLQAIDEPVFEEHGVKPLGQDGVWARTREPVVLATAWRPVTLYRRAVRDGRLGFESSSLDAGGAVTIDAEQGLMCTRNLEGTDGGAAVLSLLDDGGLTITSIGLPNCLDPWQPTSDGFVGSSWVNAASRDLWALDPELHVVAGPVRVDDVSDCAFVSSPAPRAAREHSLACVSGDSTRIVRIDDLFGTPRRAELLAHDAGLVLNGFVPGTDGLAVVTRRTRTSYFVYGDVSFLAGTTLTPVLKNVPMPLAVGRWNEQQALLAYPQSEPSSVMFVKACLP